MPKLTRGVLPQVQSQEVIRADKYNKDIEVIMLAINAQDDKLVNSEIKDVAGMVNTYAELPEVSQVPKGTRFIVKNDENTGKEYVTYTLIIDVETGGLEWVVSSVGTPLATANSDGLLSAADFKKLQEFNLGDIPATKADVATLETKVAKNEQVIAEYTSKANINKTNIN